MEEIGRVLEVTEDTARVSIKRKSQCAECEAKECCLQLTPGEMVLDAKNDVGAKEGEMVRVYLESETAIAAGAIVYLFPIFFFLLGFAIGALVARFLGLAATEFVGIITAFIFLTLSYFAINRFYGEGKKGEKRFKPIVKEVVKIG